jgi:glycosyltransferase involved in cell wall biosynthesis
VKILFPLEVFYPSQAGGPANSVYWITRRLKTHGFQPIVVASNKGLPADVPTNIWLENEAGRTIFVRTRNFRVPIRQTIIALRNILRADIVQISSIFYPAGTAAGIVARLLGKKIVWSPRGELDPKALKYSRWRKRFFLYLVKMFVGTSATYHSTCDEETEYIKNTFGKNARIVQIPNFIEMPEPVKRVGQRYFLYLGRLDKKKAIDNLLYALAISSAFKDSDLVLRVAGTGIRSYEEYLRSLVSELDLGEKVQFLGQVSGDQKQSLLANAYFTLMPSHTENFGNVVLESLAQNTPVLASRGTPWSALEENKIGLWVDNSPQYLSAAIDQLVNLDPASYNEMRAGARDFVLNNYDIEMNQKRWIEFYESL